MGAIELDLPFHFAVCALLAVLLWPAFGAYSLLVFLTGFLIDADHWLWYAAHGTIGLRKVYEKAKYGRETGKLDVFHTIEFIFAAIVFSWLFLKPFFAPLVLGFASHITLDLFYHFVIARGKHSRRYSSIIKWLMAKAKNKSPKSVPW